MRVRDILRASFEAAIQAGALGDYRSSGRFDRPERYGAVFRTADRRAAHYASTEGPLYRDYDAWRRAFQFAHAFTAGQASRAIVRPPYRLEHCFGSFGRTDPKDAMHCVGAAMEGAGMKRIAIDETTSEALFDASDSARLESLPEPYGKWLMLQQGQLRWDKPVSLRLVARCRLEQSYAAPDSRETWPQTYLTLSLSAPAVSLVEVLEASLHPRLAVAAATARVGTPTAMRLLAAIPAARI
jgi:hypothetical protein